ncbi:hypothetical protein MMC15_000570 [Xylographa vitiligo]|nr:hypothetical protein [Xylographa vitiligo]
MPQSQSSIFKLYDHRALPAISEDSDIRTWTLAREEALCDFIKAGDRSAFLASVDEDWPSYITGWSVAQQEAFLGHTCRQLYAAETAVYSRLESLQGGCIPTIYAAALLVDDGNLDTNFTVIVSDGEQQRESFPDLLNIPGILIQCIDGFLLEDLATRAPESVGVVNKICDPDVINRDVRPTNMLVARPSSGKNGSWKVVMVDCAISELRHGSKGDKDWREEKRTLDEEGAIGYVTEMTLKRAKQAGRRIFKGPLSWVYTPSDRCRPTGMSV